MATMELRRVPYGTTFTVFGDEFVALDYINGGVLAIRRDIWKDAPFDREGVNDLRKATINGTLADYEDMICEAGAAGNLRTMDVDLRATDGTREYGCCAGICVSLLTLEQYGKYQHIIPDVDSPWWLATPWRTPGEKCGGSTYAWHVFSNGNAHYSSCTYACGVRPALLFNPSLLISLELEGEEKAEEDAEKDTYAAYCKYVRGWAVPDGEQELGSSPLSYEDWKNWKEP